jgi:succinate dehydrogenase/fumarate reductase flavoprotein subunit
MIELRSRASSSEVKEWSELLRSSSSSACVRGRVTGAELASSIARISERERQRVRETESERDRERAEDQRREESKENHRTGIGNLWNDA